MCLDTKELNLEDMESEVEYWEVPMEDVAVKSSGTIKKWRRGQHLVAGRCGEPKEVTRGTCGSRKKLAATCRKVSHCARVAWHKKNVVRNKWIRAKDQ
jgi:hypothetical protein